MRVSFTIGVYQQRRPTDEQWTALIPEAYNAVITGQGEVRLRERMIEQLRGVLRGAAPIDQDLFQFPIGTELVRLPVDAKTDKARVHGQLPLIIEPRWVDSDRQHLFVYHPLHRDHWFVSEDRAQISELVNTYVRHYWPEIEEDEVEGITSNGKDRLFTIAFTTEPKSLLDQLPSRKKDERMAAFASRGDRVLSDLAVDETQRTSAGTLRLGVPRSPYRERL
jgi:ATP-dependent Clp protease ATP-binding subunit ClpC